MTEPARPDPARPDPASNGGSDPRELARHLLQGVLAGGRTLTELEAAPPLSEAPPATRARAGRLARATLRHLGQADAALGPHLHRPPRPDIRDILRLATVEMKAEGGAPHGVVSAAVTTARRRQAKAAGMVNAVLRRVSEMPDADWAALPPRRLPGWMRGRLSSAYGNARVAEMEALFSSAPPVDLTLRAAENAEDWAARLGGQTLPTGSIRLERAGQVSALEGYDDGKWWVQDAAAALCARVLAAHPGEQVLDLCAAPGGKTLQLADAGADVIAVDISEARLARLAENLARTGLSARVVTADVLDWSPPAPVDAILLDAPCTATGTLRRHPDLPFVRGKDALAPLVALQSAMLDKAAGWLGPGGRLVYCTCSLLPEEGEAQVAAVQARHPELEADARALDALPGLDAAWRRAPGTLRITPESWRARGGIDGFFIAALRRAA